MKTLLFVSFGEMISREDGTINRAAVEYGEEFEEFLLTFQKSKLQ